MIKNKYDDTLFTDDRNSAGISENHVQNIIIKNKQNKYDLFHLRNESSGSCKKFVVYSTIFPAFYDFLNRCIKTQCFV